MNVPENSLHGRRIAITGAGRGLGRALAIVAADQGAELVLLGRDPAALNEVAAVIRDRSGKDAQVVDCDLGDTHSVALACKAVLEQNPMLDTLINNGAPWLEGYFGELSDEQITATVAAGVSGTVLITKGLLPGLRRSEAADILTVISTSGITGWDLAGGSVPFYAAKHGQSGFHDKLRYELRDTEIRVSAVYPPNFDEADPADADWDRTPDRDSKLSNREVVSTILFMLAAPRTCNFPVIVMERT